MSVITLLLLNSKAAVRTIAEVQHFFTVMGKINAWEVRKNLVKKKKKAGGEKV